MSRFVTCLFPTASCGRFLRAVLVCVLTLSLFAVSGLTVASPAQGTVSTTAMAPASGPDHEGVATLPMAGAMLDLDDQSGEGRPSTAAASASVVPVASLGLSHTDDDNPGQIGVPLPERPPRA